MPQFVVVQGGEYGFLPGLQALRWIANIDSKSDQAADKVGSEETASLT